MGVGLLQRCVLFEGLARQALEEAQGEGRRVVRARGACFFRQEDPARHAYVVLSGRVKLQSVDPVGKTVIHRTAGPGDISGGLALLGEQTYPVSAEAWEVCEALVRTGEELR